MTDQNWEQMWNEAQAELERLRTAIHKMGATAVENDTALRNARETIAEAQDQIDNLSHEKDALVEDYEDSLAEKEGEIDALRDLVFTASIATLFDLRGRTLAEA